MKRVVVISDLHCGHIAGLTHPNYDAKPPDTANEYSEYKLRRKYYDWYRSELQKLNPIDVLIVNGDAIDGRGERSGSTELLTTDRSNQCMMAVAAINEAKASKVFMTYGTPYHVGDAEDWENFIADKVEAEDISSHGFINVNGLVFDYKHKVGSSSVPYGRFTQVAKEKLWNSLWAEYEEHPKADVFIRSHVHYFGFAGQNGWLGITTPALQGHTTKYGERQCSGTVDYGFVHFDVEDDGEYAWQEHIYKPKKARVVAIEV